MLGMNLDERVLLEIDNLKAFYLVRDQLVKSVNGISLKVHKSESVAIFGESGSGKSSVALAILGLFETIARSHSSSGADKETKDLWLLRDDAKSRGLTSEEIGQDLPGVEGEILFKGRDLLKMEDDEKRTIIGNDITYIPQGTSQSLNPSVGLWTQALESVRAKESTLPERELHRRVLETLDLVDLDVEDMLANPGGLSVGEAQRMLTAMALIPNPSLVIADEPSTAVDSTVQRWILDALRIAKDELGVSFLVISNDRAVVAETADKVSVMTGGQIVEFGDASRVLNDPGHPFSEAFLMAFPTMEMIRRMKQSGQKLRGISGPPPNPADLPPGCVFHTRCTYVSDICKEDVPDYREVEAGHWISCHRFEEIRQ
jgi:oligopeptide/dipeptide ABC transporter ATP-binding protein